MISCTLPPMDDGAWEVPTFDAAIYAEKRHRQALVIPVINEGDRIRGQLERIKQADLPVDVIIADGGSTDGSLDADFVRFADVRAVLTKTGPGKLSAQLRMAYAWCLKQGYVGIVTIDGNGKDGVEAVADMVAKLNEGCDYVQGSRYLPGGEAENTPLERTIANRLIHAPLLSLSGRHVFTDTTNGFRAYSARYLLHPDVRPFRDEFQVYGLLFYLTVRAGQLGLKVDHVPVVRRYPDNGKVPTKIGGFASKLALLGETVFAATGGNTPDEAVTKRPSFLWPLIVTLVVMLPLFLSVVVMPRYSPDSWAFYELSQTVFGDFYRFSHFRNYSSESAYSSAFPPLWPGLIAVVDAALATGARTGLYLAFACFVGFALVSEAIGRRVTGADWLGLATALVLLLGPGMVWVELAAGRTVPLQLLLYALVLLALMRGDRISAVRAGGIGLLAGLAILNRFDAILLPFLCAGMVGWLTRKPVRALAVLLGAAVAVSPWIAYSLTTFSHVFATDNSGIATSIDPKAFVTDWWPTPQPAMADDPAAWVAKVAANVGGLILNGVRLLVSPTGIAFAMSLAVPGILMFVASRRPDAHSAIGHLSKQLWIVTGFAAITAALMLPQVLTGYLEYRYYTALFWVSFLTVACWALAGSATVHQRRTYGRLVFLVIAPFALGFSAWQLASASRSGELDFDRWAEFEAPENVRTLEQCLKADRSARVLVFGDDNFAAQAGALAGLRTMMEPRNLVDGRLDSAASQSFLDIWRVDYVLGMAKERSGLAIETLDLSEVQGCSLPLFSVNR